MHGTQRPGLRTFSRSRSAGTSRRTGFIVGLKAEARILRALGHTGVGGGTPAGAEAAAEALVAAGATELVSFGLAGGLDPALRPGDVVIPTAVLCNGERYDADPGLVRRLGGATTNTLLAGAVVAATADAKAALFQASGAAAIDLESGAVARVAQRHKLPFAVLRVICDPASRDLPPAALAALDGRGAIRAVHVLAAIARNPKQIPALIRLARDAQAAQTILRAAVRDLYRLP